MLDLGVDKFFRGANSGGGLAEVGNKRSSNGKCEFQSLTSGRTFGLILVIGVLICRQGGGVAGADLAAGGVFDYHTHSPSRHHKNDP